MTSQKLFLDIVQTYDFNTEVGKVGVVAFHTPGRGAIDHICDGALKNFRKIYFKSMDFALACVSQLPVDPLGVGFEAGKIAPQDVVNPILFKACSGESLNVFLNTIYNGSGSGSNTNMASISKQDIKGLGADDMDFGAYYRMMNDPTFRKAHPQQGMVVNGLVPLVRQVLVNRQFGRFSGDNVGNANNNPNYVPFTSGNEFPTSFGTPVTDDDLVSGANIGTTDVQFMNGPLVHLPAQDTMTVPKFDLLSNNSTVADFVKAYLGVLVLPPAYMQSLYFRLQVVWHVVLESYRPSYEIASLIGGGEGYFDFMTRPVDEATAQAMSMMKETTEVVDGIGIENVENISSSVL